MAKIDFLYKSKKWARGSRGVRKLANHAPRRELGCAPDIYDVDQT